MWHYTPHLWYLFPFLLLFLNSNGKNIQESRFGSLYCCFLRIRNNIVLVGFKCSSHIIVVPLLRPTFSSRITPRWKFLTYLCPIQGAQLLESNIVIRSISPENGRCVMTSIISRMLLLETYKRISVLLLCFFFLDWCLIFVFDRTNCATKKPLLFNYYSTGKIILMRF